jgi:hypothetical protein
MLGFIVPVSPRQMGVQGNRVQLTGWMEGLFDDCDGEFPPLTPVRQTAEGFVRLFVPVL